jgi:hypothetical protein
MDIHRIIFGFFVSTFGGAFVLWLLIDKVAWPYIAKKHNIPAKASDVLTLPLGIVERTLYTAALIIGAPEWIAVWLAMKVAVVWSRWQGEERVTYNVFLIGNALSVMFGLIGAWIALGQLPSFTR